jgi:alcohol dehydrogenase
MTGTSATAAIPMSEVIARELEIIGSHGMQAHRYADMFQFIRSKGVDLQKMVTETISLEQLPGRLPVMPDTLTPGITVVSNF